MKKKIAIILLLVMSLMLMTGCSYVLYADDTYVYSESAAVQPVMPYFGDDYDEYYD